MTEQPQSGLLVGGSSEIGMAITEALLGPAPGRAVLAGRPTAELDAAAARLSDLGHDTTTIGYDAAWDADRTTAMIRAAWRTGGFDAVVLAVGWMGGGSCDATAPGRQPTTLVAEPDLEHVLRTNLIGPALVANAVADHLAGQRHGTLVVITSAAAIHPRNDILGYSAAKQALDTFVRGLDHRLRRTGARCLVVRPGRVSTRMTAGLDPVPLTTDPAHVAARVRTALSTGASVSWSPRTMPLVAHGLRVTPTRILPRSLQ